MPAQRRDCSNTRYMRWLWHFGACAGQYSIITVCTSASELRHEIRCTAGGTDAALNFAVSCLTRAYFAKIFTADVAEKTQVNILYSIHYFLLWVRGSVVGWGNMLQAVRSRVLFPMRSLDFSIYLVFPRTVALESSQPLTELNTRNLRGGKGWPARKTDNLTAICEPIV
jgi:hypothetical protein